MSDDRNEDETASPMETGMAMARKMMAQMGKGEPNPMAMMQKMMGRMAEAGQAPPPMMQMCMGMCSEMLTAIKRSTEMAAFASPELHGLFAEWLETLEERAVAHLREHGATDLAGLAEALEIGRESAAFLLANLARKSRISLRAEAL